MTRITGTLGEEYTIFVTFRAVLLRMINVSDKSPRENQNTHFILSIFFPENLTVYKIRWKNIVEPKRAQMAICRTRIECWIPKVTDARTEYVRLTAFPLQHCASMLRYMCIACLVILLVSLHIAINCVEFCLERDKR